MEEKKEVEIDLKKLFKYYVHNWFALILSGIVCGLIAFAVTYFLITPQYRASIMVYVNNSNDNQSSNVITSSNLAVSQRLVNTYVSLVKSDAVLKDVVEQGGLNCKAAGVRGMMSAKQVDETEIFTVSIVHPDPQMAAHIANTIANVAPGKIASFVTGSSAKVIQYAEVPSAPYTPNYSRNVTLGVLLGVLLVGIFLTFRYLYDMRINDEDDIAAYFTAPVLGVIPEFTTSNRKKGGHFEGTSKVTKGGH